MKYITKVLQELEAQNKKHEKEVFNYVVPSLWNVCRYDGQVTYDKGMVVNPYTFYYENTKEITKRKKEKEYLQPLSLMKKKSKKDGNWIKESFVYSMMIRTSGAFDHDRDGYVLQNNMYNIKESGTFLKCIQLIPYLKKMGIDTLYLLPFFETSSENKKGEFGSCYAIKNFYKIDPTLKDSMLPSLSVEEECKAFMEVCHMYDMRVIIDIIPRTNAIRSSLLEEHPDWFYWMDLEESKTFKAPYIDSVPPLAVATNDVMEEVYAHPLTQKYLSLFKWDPKTADPKGYAALVEKTKKDNKDLLSEIERQYNITIACAFSDQVNDPQPVWSDVTYLRMYLDHPKLAQKFIDEKQPPYVLYDVAKANLHPGKQENRELWNTIKGIIPFYQKEYGIDGVRIDMGHALPIALVDEIIQEAKVYDPDICIIAEELDVKNDKASKEKGYNMILGNGFSEEHRILEHRYHDFYYGARELALPLFALAETHDTPRIAARDGEEVLAKLVTIMNLFTPNGVAFLNSGQEFYEKQPMNLGLDCREDEIDRLPNHDPRHHKLALFDAFHFLYDTQELIDSLEEVMPIRKKYSKEIANVKKSIPAWFNTPWDLALGSFFVKKDSAILVVANLDAYKQSVYHVQLENVLSNLPFPPKRCKEIFSTHKDGKAGYIESLHHVYVDMQPGEVKIMEIQ